jgi:hypothetical protein
VCSLELLCSPPPCRLGCGSLWQHPWRHRRRHRCKRKTLSPMLCHQEVSYQTVRYSDLCSSCDRQLAVTNIVVLTQRQCAGRHLRVCEAAGAGWTSSTAGPRKGRLFFLSASSFFELNIHHIWHLNTSMVFLELSLKGVNAYSVLTWGT